MLRSKLSLKIHLKKEITSRIRIAMNISNIQKYYWLLPIIYLVSAVFWLRSNVLYIYMGASVLFLVTFGIQRLSVSKPDVWLARWMAALAAVGISAAVVLSIEKIELLTEPSHVASCSLSPVVACSPIIASPQASAFGFANSFIGIFGFTAVFAAAMTIAAGASKLHKVWWRTLLGGITFAAGFCVWLFYQGVFDIGKLCLYCMLVWLIAFALLWLVAAYCIENKYVNLGLRLNKLLKYKYELIVFTYTAIFMLLFYRWSDYWLSLFNL